MRLHRSDPRQAVEVVIDATINYRFPDGSDTTHAVVSAYVEPSNTADDTFSLAVAPETDNPSQWVSQHCGGGQSCSIANISIDHVDCWDYANRPAGRVQLGEPQIRIRP